MKAALTQCMKNNFGLRLHRQIRWPRVIFVSIILVAAVVAGSISLMPASATTPTAPVLNLPTPDYGPSGTDVSMTGSGFLPFTDPGGTLHTYPSDCWNDGQHQLDGSVFQVSPYHFEINRLTHTGHCTISDSGVLAADFTVNYLVDNGPYIIQVNEPFYPPAYVYVVFTVGLPVTVTATATTTTTIWHTTSNTTTSWSTAHSMETLWTAVTSPTTTIVTSTSITPILVTSTYWRNQTATSLVWTSLTGTVTETATTETVTATSTSTSSTTATVPVDVQDPNTFWTLVAGIIVIGTLGCIWAVRKFVGGEM